MKYDLIQKNPMEHVTLPKLRNQIYFDEEREKVNFFTIEELEAFLLKAKEVMSFRDFTLFRLLPFTGMRKGEALALHWSDIDFHKGSITIQKTLDMDNGKNYLQTAKTIESKRVIDVDQITLSILKEWQELQKEEYTKLNIIHAKDKEPVFTRLDAKEMRMKYLRLASPNDTLASFFSKHEGFSKITVHGFRHTHASLYFEAGATVKAVQDRLGHSDIQTTMNVYTHMTKTDKEKSSKLFWDHVGF